MKSILAAIFTCLCVAFHTFGATQSLYFVGGFNNWDISHPEIATPGANGIFEVDIDFSNNREFKISTVNPEGSWTRFDEGTLYPNSTVKDNEWIYIQEFQKSPNIDAPEKRVYTVKVDLDNMRLMFSTDISGHEPWSGTLPVMFITTEGNQSITSKDEYLQAHYYIDPMGVEGVEAIGSLDDQALMQIRGRGNYTWWGFDKKPYRIKLDKKTELLGMNKSKHFALLAHADDSAAGLRNALGFAASEAIGMPWTPATRPLEVVLNGDYIGLYWLTETIRVDKDRVNIVEQADDAIDDVDGGWLVEIDNYDSDPHVTIMDTSGHPIWLTYKSPEVLSQEQQSYLQTAMQSIQNALASGNESEANSLVDFDILARYFIVNQLMLDMESFHGSCYLNRQRGEDGKWKFGPVWDFGNAFAAGRADKPRFIFDHPDFSQTWIGEFYAMPTFVEIVKKIWSRFLAEGPDMLSTALHEYADQIAAAAISDGKRWPKYSHADVARESERLQSWLYGSIEWLKTQWGSDADVESIENDHLSFRIDGKDLIIESSSNSKLPLFSIDGTTRILTLNPGINTFHLPSGIYICNFQKFAIH
ncbi:MAG: CotH kinase family protein [Muribaculaceae bacterium]|nr:CotH kinase family protein [Muribaculaceae bacterium]